jgi:hypothetical protein
MARVELADMRLGTPFLYERTDEIVRNVLTTSA